MYVVHRACACVRVRLCVCVFVCVSVCLWLYVSDRGRNLFDTTSTRKQRLLFIPTRLKSGICAEREDPAFYAPLRSSKRRIRIPADTAYDRDCDLRETDRIQEGGRVFAPDLPPPDISFDIKGRHSFAYNHSQKRAYNIVCTHIRTYGRMCKDTKYQDKLLRY